MPQLILPILIKRDPHENHKPNKFLHFDSQNKLITGSNEGDMVIWRKHPDQLEPLVYLTTNLTNHVGKLTCFRIINKTIFQFTELVENCLLTIHSDNRIRLWDLNDGQCFLISSNNTFSRASEINFCQAVCQPQSRYYVCGGKSNQLYFLDIWKLSVQIRVKICDSNETYVCGITKNEQRKELYVLDSKNILYVYDIHSFYKQEINNFQKLIIQKEEFSQMIQVLSPILIKKIYLSAGGSNIPRSMHYNIESNYFIIVYETEINFYPREDIWQLSTVKSNSPLNMEKNLSSASSATSSSSPIQNQSGFISIGNNNQKLSQTPEIQVVEAIQFLRVNQFRNYQFNCVLETRLENNDIYYLVSTDEQVILGINSSDIAISFEIINKTQQAALSFGYGIFSFLQELNQQNASTNQNMNQIMDIISEGERQEKLDSKAFFENQCLITVDAQMGHLFAYNPYQNIFSFYDLRKTLNDNSHLIQQILCFFKNGQKPEILKEEDEESIITSNGYSIFLNQNLISYANQFFKALKENNYQLNKVQLNLQVDQPVYEQQLKHSSTTLKSENLFHEGFYKQFRNSIETLPNDTITVSYCLFFEQQEPFFILGTNQGNVYIFPLTFHSNENKVTAFKVKTMTDSITHLAVLREHLFVTGSQGHFTIVNLKGIAQHLKKGHSEVLQRVVSKDQRQMRQSSMAEEKQNDLGNGAEIDFIQLKGDQFIVSQTVMVSSVRRVSKIQNLPQLQLDPALQAQLQQNKLFLKNLAALMLANNEIVIYNFSEKKFEFHIRSCEGAPYGVYYHFAMDYFVIFNTKGACNFWSLGSGKFDKSDKFEKYISLFSISELLEKNYQDVEQYNTYQVYKKLNEHSCSKLFSILEFNSHYHHNIVNFFDESSSQSVTHNYNYEAFGDLWQTAKDIKDEKAKDIFVLLQQKRKMPFVSRSESVGANILQIRFNAEKLQNFENTGYLLYMDVKQNTHQMQELFQNLQTQMEIDNHFSYMPFIFPWGIDQQLDEDMGDFLNYKRPVFNYIIGSQGMGECFSFSLRQSSNWAISRTQTSIQALALALYFLVLEIRDNDYINNLMFKVTSYLTVKKTLVSSEFQNLSLPVLVRFTIDDTFEVMTAGINLMISTMVDKNDQMQKVAEYSQYFFSINFKYVEMKDIKMPSIIETTWIVMLYQFELFSQLKLGVLKDCYQRIYQVATYESCIQVPTLVGTFMKLLFDFINKTKEIVTNHEDLIQNLMFIYFHYNTTQQYIESIKKETPLPMPQQKSALDQFEVQPESLKKRMKQQTIKTLVTVGWVYFKDFQIILQKEISNETRHPLYPCCIIDIIRNIFKYQMKQCLQELSFFSDIIIKTLDINSNLRRICVKPAISALHIMWKQYPNVSFQQELKKFVVGTKQSKIIVYDLQQGTQWRVFEGHEGPISCLCFDNAGQHLASFCLYDQTVRVWKVNNTGFFGAILNAHGKHYKKFSLEKSDTEKIPNINAIKIKIFWENEDNTIVLQFGEVQFKKFNL